MLRSFTSMASSWSPTRLALPLMKSSSVKSSVVTSSVFPAVTQSFSRTPFTRSITTSVPKLIKASDTNLVSTSTITSAPPKFGVKSTLKRKRNLNNVVLWKMYATFNRHNTLLTFVAVEEDPDFLEKNPDLSYTEQVLYYLQLPHHPKLHVSAGQLGFRKAQRAEYEAGYQVSARLFKLIEDQKLLSPNDKVELILKNFGKGREAFLAALQGREGVNVKDHIVRISDATKLKFGGTRSKKLRRL